MPAFFQPIISMQKDIQINQFNLPLRDVYTRNPTLKDFAKFGDKFMKTLIECEREGEREGGRERIHWFSYGSFKFRSSITHLGAMQQLFYKILKG